MRNRNTQKTEEGLPDGIVFSVAISSSHVQLIWLSFINMLERMLDEQNLEPFFIAHKNLRAPTWAYQKWINMIYLTEEHFILLIISVPSVFQKLQIISNQLPFRAISVD